MDPVLLVFTVLIVVFLVVVALVYLLRPPALMNCDEDWPDVDMWKTFAFAMVVAIAHSFVVWFVLKHAISKV